MAEEDVVVLRKRRDALDRAIAALEELQLLELAGGHSDRAKSSSLVAFPSITHHRHSQRKKF